MSLLLTKKTIDKKRGKIKYRNSSGERERESEDLSAYRVTVTVEMLSKPLS